MHIRIRQYFITVLLVYIPMLGCQSDATVVPEVYFEPLQPSTNLQAVLIIPKVGCGGCISDATAFVKNHCNELNSTKVVLTAYEGKKELALTFKNCYESKLFHFDSENRFYNPMDTLSIYPKIYYRESGIWKHKPFALRDTSLLH